jgi:alpha-beta hydrolase superfamily lysophospholipase
MSELHVGWYELHPNVSLNFQLNRWAAYGGPRWLDDVRPVIDRLSDYDAWRNAFVDLGNKALDEGRKLHAALHFRCAEFFMTVADPRKDPLRKQLLTLFRESSQVDAAARREVPFGRLRLPTWQLSPPKPRGTFVVCGGFDSYIEEFFPILLHLRNQGWNVIAFEGPGQGSVLEEQHAPMTPDWHAPVTAVLDSFGVSDATLVGISLGGCLAIRAAAHEPRIRRVVAFDVLTDFFEVMIASQPLASRALLRGVCAVHGATLLDPPIRAMSRRSPLVSWGIEQAMRVFGVSRPSDALKAAKRLGTRDVSYLVTQDVLLLAGANDHYVPLGQLWEQGRSLSHARSVTARVFSAREQAQAHCQVGNLPLALDEIVSWVERRTRQ